MIENLTLSKFFTTKHNTSAIQLTNLNENFTLVKFVINKI